MERIVAGLEKRHRVMSDQERRTVAVHEMGHALVAIVLPGTDPVHKISIIPRGIGALGYTLQRPTEDRYLIRRSELENRLAVLFGGRAAEALVIGELSTGAADDLAKATDSRAGHGDALRHGRRGRAGRPTSCRAAPSWTRPASCTPSGRTAKPRPAPSTRRCAA